VFSLYHFSIESVDDPRQDLARRVKSVRRARFMSQEELSDRSGLGRATIARIELGQTVPHGRTIRSLAEALEVQPSDLVSDPDSLWGTR
jgi:transcriptional regulator with XRE-family HTH domain